MASLTLLMVIFLANWKLSNAIVINCTFDMFTYALVGSVYQCTANLSFVDQDNERVTAIYGDHQSEKENVHVQGLDINNQSMEVFPVNINEFFPNLRVLNFPQNSITHFTNAHLIPLPNLEYVNLFGNRLTLLDSNLFSGLESLQYIDFGINNIKHVGHEFVLPDAGIIYLFANPCIDRYAVTPEEIMYLRFSLLVNCPPTISQIEHILESRPNLLTNVSGQVQCLQESHTEMNDEINSLNNELIDLKQSNVQLTIGVTDLQESHLELINEVADLQNKNTQLEMRYGFLDTRAGHLEARVAFLEEMIESTLGLKVKQVISEY